MFHKKNQYIIWDGYKEQEYIENTKIHDCMVFHNSELILVQKVRKQLLTKGFVPTIIFACKQGESSHEIEINGKCYGVFSYYYTEVLGIPKITYREAIKRINELIKTSGISQTCEIICRVDILDMEINNKIEGQKHCSMTFDMCRS